MTVSQAVEHYSRYAERVSLSANEWEWRYDLYNVHARDVWVPTVITFVPAH